MSEPQQPETGGADHTRSGDDVVEAVQVAEEGSSVREAHDRPAEAKPGAAPVEQSGGDPEMTEGQVVLGEGAGGKPTPGVDPREAAGSGGAQSQPGARVSDRAAAGEPLPDGPPFDS